ncbi:hypothetical protein [Carnobacterium sp. ISL-102]|uniref:hypothetical protein n=1 Tax=Carnobacterium sp. ISL-102 TaxID=2819142 RepID=UPI001BE57BB5|nr:hypothetical protein [Carnobacterium sp. ISL-102]MBT2732126.1 hypothetical protein [Carnobacterium sp. ISL-102]
MNGIVGNQIKYILIQTNTVEGSTAPQEAMFYNEYNNTLTSSGDINTATKFKEEDLEKVQSIASLQTQLAALFGKLFKYEVIKETIERTVVE